MKKATWYLVGILLVALAVVVISCGGSSTPATPATPAPAPAPAAPAKPATPAPAPAAPAPAAPAATAIPKIPHTLDGRTDCLVCHKDGITAPKVSASPTNHATFTSAMCLGCHGSGVAGAPKLVGHEARTATDCLTCHKDGIKAPKVSAGPTNHASFTSAVCQGCHKTS
jgi:predicted CXXCH cytochrome family protein